MLFSSPSSNILKSGILCYLKDSLIFTFGGHSGLTSTTDPQNLICTEKGSDFYLNPIVNNCYVEFNFFHYSALITSYYILGRNYYQTTDVMQSFQITGLTNKAKWVVLDTIRNKPLINKELFNFTPIHKQWIKSIRITNIGLASYITDPMFNYINTFGGFEVFGQLRFGDEMNSIICKTTIPFLLSQLIFLLLY